jgi:hypothetical protein
MSNKITSIVTAALGGIVILGLRVCSRNADNASRFISPGSRAAAKIAARNYNSGNSDNSAGYKNEIFSERGSINALLELGRITKILNSKDSVVEINEATNVKNQYNYMSKFIFVENQNNTDTALAKIDKYLTNDLQIDKSLFLSGLIYFHNLMLSKLYMSQPNESKTGNDKLDLIRNRILNMNKSQRIKTLETKGQVFRSLLLKVSYKEFYPYHVEFTDTFINRLKRM